MTTVAIIIPVKNAETTITQCLNSIYNLKLDNIVIEVVVVDNGSTDASQAIATSFGCEVLKETIGGQFAARNAGIRHSRSKYIAFVDADCIVENNWIANYIEKIKNYHVMGGRILPIDSTKALGRTSEINQMWCINHSLAPFVCTSNAFFRRDVIEKLNMFDPCLRSGGDIELGFRMKQRGIKIGYADDAIVHHHHRKTLSGVAEQYFRYGYNEGMVFARNAQVLKRTVWISLDGPHIILDNILNVLCNLIQFRRDNVVTCVMNVLKSVCFICGRISAGIAWKKFIV